jgi:hypothetical protein
MQLWALHAPSTHRSVFAQRLPHLPQLLKSAMKSRHCPLQLVNPGRHWHEPAMQAWASAHCVLQLPQKSGLFVVSAQVCPHMVPVQLHVPLLHTSPSAQDVPQALQCCGSSVRFVQVPPQSVFPLAQLHAPAEQVSPAPQVVPQCPQWAASEVRSTQPIVGPQ